MAFNRPWGVMMLRMCVTRVSRVALVLILAGASLVVGPAAARGQVMAGTTPKVGEKAHEFTLAALDGGKVSLSGQLARGPVVLVMLRGWPGYQCPFCTRQFGDYLTNADAIGKAGARVVFVYPGPAAGLADHAKAFTEGKGMPPVFTFLTDPDYRFTNLYGLRWDAPKETSYPSTFVLDRQGVVTFAHTSREHGDRVAVADVLKALEGVRK